MSPAGDLRANGSSFAGELVVIFSEEIGLFWRGSRLPAGKVNSALSEEVIAAGDGFLGVKSGRSKAKGSVSTAFEVFPLAVVAGDVVALSSSFDPAA